MQWPALDTLVLEFFDPGLDLLSLASAGQHREKNPFLVKVTVGHTCSNLPEAASGDFGHTAKRQKMFPNSAVETHCSCGSSSGDGAFWSQKLHVDGHDGC